MLPFLKRHNEGSASTPVELVKRKPDDEAEYDALESAVEDLFAAYKSNDIKAGCVALRAAFDLLDGEPHAEGPHVEDKS
jgi:hypothetical protein